MYFSVNPAVAIDLKKGFCLNFSMGGIDYKSTKPDTANAESTNTFGLTFGRQMNIGASKNF